MYSSTSTPAGYFAERCGDLGAHLVHGLATESWVMPFEEPSKLGFTMTGKCRFSALQLVELLDELPARRADAVLARGSAW